MRDISQYKQYCSPRIESDINYICRQHFCAIFCNFPSSPTASHHFLQFPAIFCRLLHFKQFSVDSRHFLQIPVNSGRFPPFHPKFSDFQFSAIFRHLLQLPGTCRHFPTLAATCHTIPLNALLSHQMLHFPTTSHSFPPQMCCGKWQDLAEKVSFYPGGGDLIDQP